jgi:HNH endonuclease
MNTLVRLRRLAFTAQQGRCFYCAVPMWLAHPSDLAGFDPLSKFAPYLKCTAEHLKPVSEGGRDEPGNIVAACRFCNWTRHRTKKVLSPERYAQRVRARVALGRWHVAGIGRYLNPAIQDSHQ